MVDSQSLEQRIGQLCATLPAVEWSICIRRGANVVAEVHADRVLNTASVGKALLLIDAAERIASDPSFASVKLPRPDVPVGDSGLWQHLSLDALTVRDACVLVASVSDNLATNALIDELGLEQTREIAIRLGCADVELHDVVRDVRGPEDPPCLSVGSAVSLSALMAELAGAGSIAPAAAAQVRDWLRLGVDHSMALRDLGRDPLLAGGGCHPFVGGKTGSDPGVRADTGFIGSGRDALVYAVIANWADPGVEPALVSGCMGWILAESLTGH